MKILERGYSKLWKEKHPTYEDVYVCEEWHNFQNFANGTIIIIIVLMKKEWK